MSRDVGGWVGVQAPGFELERPDGGRLSLSDVLGKGPVVLFFVPHPPRGVCARTECGLRDSYSRLREAGARVVGVSPMSPRTHARVQEEHGLPFELLSDRDRSVSRRYGVGPVMGFVPGRATFVLDSRGVVRWVERSPLMATKHVEGATRAVQRLSQKTRAEELT